MARSEAPADAADATRTGESDGRHSALLREIRLLVHHEALDLSVHLRGFDDVERLRIGEKHAVLRARA